MASNFDEKTQFFWLLFVAAIVLRRSPIFLHSKFRKNEKMKNEKIEKRSKKIGERIEEFFSQI